MGQLIYTDDAPEPKVRKPRRKKYAPGKYPRLLNSESRDVKLLKLPWGQFCTLTDAAACMGIERNSLRTNYLYSTDYALPTYIEVVKDMGRIVGLKRVGP